MNIRCNFFFKEELCTSRGFGAESHQFLSDDGYYMTLNRIVNPYYRNRTKPSPVLFWHGIASNSLIWLINNVGHLDKHGVYSEMNGKLINDCVNRFTSNLPFSLSACGYDVWLGNVRGTRFAFKNIKYSRFCKYLLNK